VGAGVRIETITSKDNPRVKQARSLRQRSNRQAAGLFLVEGIRHVGEAAAAAAAGRGRIESIFFSPDLLNSEFALNLVEEQARQGVGCFSVPEKVFVTLAEKDNPQGIVAVVQAQQVRLEDLHPGNFPWGVALVAPQDPGNIGTILRTIDAVGASGLLLLENSADPYLPGAVRASMGSLFWYPLVRASFAGFSAWARQNEYFVYGTSARGSQDYRDVKEYASPRVLLMGSEREGLSEEQMGACNQLLRLPMQGRVSSLNLAVATGVFLFDMHAKPAEISVSR
jgi:RNA methyltransferase, TrmH family